MKIMIVGAGEVGYHIADRLCREGHDVTMIERDPHHARELQKKLNALVIEASGASTEALEQADVASMGLFIAVTESDEVNLIAGLLASDFGVPRVIARIKSLEYSKTEWRRNAEKLGISVVINPQLVVADEIIHSMSYSSAAEVAEFAHGRVVFIGYTIGANSQQPAGRRFDAHAG
jgi:trk system potassium uptake protein TrkA